MVVILIWLVNRFGDILERHGKRRAEYPIENDCQKRAITEISSASITETQSASIAETQDTLLKSDKFNNSNSNLPSFTASTLITLPPDINLEVH
jgi:hypothetical protein